MRLGGASIEKRPAKKGSAVTSKISQIKAEFGSKTDKIFITLKEKN